MIPEPTTPNDKVYIHEFIEIIGHNRANYMHHMTANWSPMAREVRDQKCYGVWGTVGTTGRWPEVTNLWEEDGFAGLSRSFRHELNHPSLQDPDLAEWWARASQFRRGGLDRVLVPAPWTHTIDGLCALDRTFETYAHEIVNVAAGTAWDYLERVREHAIPVHLEFGWELIGAWVTSMRNDDEVLLLWAIPEWGQWGELEDNQRRHAGLAQWRSTASELASEWQRFLLVDAPLSPLRLGRQPEEGDRDSYQLPD